MSMTIPHGRVSFLVRNTLIQRSTPARIAMMASIKKLEANGIGVISEAVPITNKILKILLPTIFVIKNP